MKTVTNFAVAVHFGDKTEYVGFMNATSPLLDNAIHYNNRDAAEAAMEEVIEFGSASGWQAEYRVYDFDVDVPTYKVIKQYEEKQKTVIEKKGVSFEEAKRDIQINERLWLINGGLVISSSDEELVAEESDGSETITWRIIEEE